MKLWAFVFIALFAAVLFGGDVSGFRIADAAARGAATASRLCCSSGRAVRAGAGKAKRCSAQQRFRTTNHDVCGRRGALQCRLAAAGSTKLAR